MISAISEETRLRDEICAAGKSLFDRSLTFGSTGNISVRLPDGGLLTTPTNASLGALDPARLSRLSADGIHVGGDRPTKEAFLHRCMYCRRASAGEWMPSSISSLISSERSSKLLEPIAHHVPSTVIAFWCSRQRPYSKMRTPEASSLWKLWCAACWTIGASVAWVAGVITRTWCRTRRRVLSWAPRPRRCLARACSTPRWRT